MDTVKTIQYDPCKKKNDQNQMQKHKDLLSPPQKKKKVIVETTKWTTNIDPFVDFQHCNQLNWLKVLIDPTNDKNQENNAEKIKILRDQITKKIAGYKAQDEKKKRFDAEQFISLASIYELLEKCALQCIYCKTAVNVWYEWARDPTQWTLERIDNKLGHVLGNLEICCLSCNLRRRTMHHERYAFTKQMHLVKS